MSGGTSKTRRASALANLVERRTPNLNALVRVYFLDGSSKVLQMFENSLAKHVLQALKFNLDLQDISTHALFRVVGSSMRRVELNEKMKDVLKEDISSSAGVTSVRLLFKTWITYKFGVFDSEVFQDGLKVKQPSMALWLAYMEAMFMCMTDKYFLSEDESLLLGVLKTQTESGDFDPAIHTIELIKERVAQRFPNPIKDKMKALLAPTLSGSGLADALATRVQLAYARVAGKTKEEAQIR